MSDDRANEGILDLIVQPEPDCCEVWPKIMSRFNWMVFSDDNRVASMPHIDDGEQKWFVNYCPACGKPARNRNVLASRLNAGSQHKR